MLSGCFNTAEGVLSAVALSTERLGAAVLAVNALLPSTESEPSTFTTLRSSASLLVAFAGPPPASKSGSSPSGATLDIVTPLTKLRAGKQNTHRRLLK
jgi:hypothetical protein